MRLLLLERFPSPLHCLLVYAPSSPSPFRLSQRLFYLPGAVCHAPALSVGWHIFLFYAESLFIRHYHLYTTTVLTTLILSILMWGVTLLFCPRCTVFIPFVIHALQSISCYAWIARVYEKYKSMITLPLFIFCVLKLKTLLFSRHRSTVQ